MLLVSGEDRLMPFGIWVEGEVTCVEEPPLWVKGYTRTVVEGDEMRENERSFEVTSIFVSCGFRRGLSW